MASDQDSWVRPTIKGRFRLDSKIESGGFGVVFEGTDLHTGDPVAIKVIDCVSEKGNDHEIEARFYKALALRTRRKEGVPRCLYVGKDVAYDLLVLDLLGPSLMDLLEFCGMTFTLNTVFLIADQALCRLQYLASKRVIHGDMKPENMLMGCGRYGDTLHLVDYGLARFWTNRPGRYDRDTGGTLVWRGTEREQSKDVGYFDDLEALGFILVFLANGDLPWITDDREFEKELVDPRRLDMKLALPDSDLLNWMDPASSRAFKQYFEHVRPANWTPTLKPDYKKLRSIFRRAYHAQRQEDKSVVFDWIARLHSEMGRDMEEGNQ